ncbi:DASH family cryptochrome [Mucilaginibacter sp. HMF5004]|uniref:DASH family cryptochrome n=1 Tax=Mucilaginibacter rivuli TaxID=2857527 RepID=UPI001C5DBABF|nr:DASH family cryptochrome [Mucilaginibacter rivuli]MBW4888384.1 DASH family cryptochrome [Mucilaginibacter rivuli]
MSEKTILVWFRNDLRIHDNEILVEAIRKADKVLPVFCFDPFYFRTTQYGTLKTGNFRAKFLIESVQNLRDTLRGLGGELIVRMGDPVQIIPQLAEQYQVAEVYHHREVAFEETNISSKVEAVLWKIKLNLKHFIGHTFYHKEDLPFPIKDIPDVFTVFRKKVERDSDIRPCFETPTAITVPSIADAGEMPTIAQLGLTEPVDDSRAVMQFTGGETEALQRMNHYFWGSDKLKAYKLTRNGLLGADYSSKFSPWLSVGCLSTRQVYWEVKRYEQERGANDSTYWLIFELLWRDYFRFMFKKYGNQFFKAGGFKGEAPEVSANQDELFEKWKNGQTGMPFIDANMRELNATGFMSNRGRQNVASFLVRDLKVNWTRGAAYFEEKLLDYSPASNWGNWAYVAGVGNDPRENRHFNIIKQATEYDPKGEYVKTWLPELKDIPAKLVQTPFALSINELNMYHVQLGVNYPGFIAETTEKILPVKV